MLLIWYVFSLPITVDFVGFAVSSHRFRLLWTRCIWVIATVRVFQFMALSNYSLSCGAAHNAYPSLRIGGWAWLCALYDQFKFHWLLSLVSCFAWLLPSVIDSLKYFNIIQSLRVSVRWLVVELDPVQTFLVLCDLLHMRSLVWDRICRCVVPSK